MFFKQHSYLSRFLLVELLDKAGWQNNARQAPLPAGQHARAMNRAALLHGHLDRLPGKGRATEAQLCATHIISRELQ
ncbi:hypothetical protein [Mitsuokella jalaludinii]|uniref:hypothetical protein n=1 Tax=Mitsuokella jalaludinii TaxID=187979 RepID=UPI00307A4A7A